MPLLIGVVLWLPRLAAKHVEGKLKALFEHFMFLEQERAKRDLENLKAAEEIRHHRLQTLNQLLDLGDRLGDERVREVMSERLLRTIDQLTGLVPDSHNRLPPSLINATVTSDRPQFQRAEILAPGVRAISLDDDEPEKA